MPTSTPSILPDNLHNFIDVNLPLVFVLTLVFAILVPIIVAVLVVWRTENRADSREKLYYRGRVAGILLDPQLGETIQLHVVPEIGRRLTEPEMQRLREVMLSRCESVDVRQCVESRGYGRRAMFQHLLPDLMDIAREFAESADEEE